MAGFDFYAFERGVSGRGIPVYVKKLPWISGWFTVRVLINVGATDDPWGKEGAAHFVEHMPFTGAGPFCSPEAIREMEHSLFNDTLNARTSAEWTRFEGSLLAENGKEGMSALHKVLFEPLFLVSEVDRERNVILQEIRRGVENEAIEKIQKTRGKDIYGNHSFSRFVRASGWEESVSAIVRDDLVSFHSDYYHLENITLFFVGDISLENGLRLADHFAVAAPRGSRNARIHGPVQRTWGVPAAPYREYSMKDILRSDAEVSRLVEVEVCRTLPRQENNLVLMLLGDMLREKLEEDIRRKQGAAYSVVMHRKQYTDHECCSVETKVAPFAYDEVVSAITKTLADLRDGNISPRFFEKMRRNRLNWIRMADQTAVKIADFAASDFAPNGVIQTMGWEYNEIASMTQEDVVNLARAEFGSDKLYWFILKP